MSEHSLIHTVHEDFIEISFPRAKRRLLGRLTGKGRERSFTDLSPDDRDLLLAIGDLHAWEDNHPGDVKRLRHQDEGRRVVDSALRFIEPR